MDRPVVLEGGKGDEGVAGLVKKTPNALGIPVGAPRWKVTMFVILPTAGRGILTGALLALARVAGEPAPLIFTAFGSRFSDNGWLNPIATLPHTIFNELVTLMRRDASVVQRGWTSS